jgi:hypothetical protein
VGLNWLDFTNYRFLLYGSILVLMMLFRPAGLIPSRQRRAELEDTRSDPQLAAEEDAEYTLGPGAT